MVSWRRAQSVGVEGLSLWLWKLELFRWIKYPRPLSSLLHYRWEPLSVLIVIAERDDVWDRHCPFYIWLKDLKISREAVRCRDDTHEELKIEIISLRAAREPIWYIYSDINNGVMVTGEEGHVLYGYQIYSGTAYNEWNHPTLLHLLRCQN